MDYLVVYFKIYCVTSRKLIIQNLCLNPELKAKPLGAMFRFRVKNIDDILKWPVTYRETQANRQKEGRTD